MPGVNKLIPKISHRGVFVFFMILFLGLMFIPSPLRFVGISKALSYFLAAWISSTLGMIIVLTRIDGKPEEKIYFKKRILLSVIVGLTSSALIIFIFGGDVIG